MLKSFFFINPAKSRAEGTSHIPFPKDFTLISREQNPQVYTELPADTLTARVEKGL